MNSVIKSIIGYALAGYGTGVLVSKLIMFLAQ